MPISFNWLVLWNGNKLIDWCFIMEIPITISNATVINKKTVKYGNLLNYILLEQFCWSTFCWTGFCWNSFCFFYNFNTYNNWITNTSFTFTIFIATCCRIPKISFLAHTMLFQIFTLTLSLIIISLLIRVTFSTIKLTFKFAFYSGHHIKNMQV